MMLLSTHSCFHKLATHHQTLLSSLHSHRPSNIGVGGLERSSSSSSSGNCNVGLRRGVRAAGAVHQQQQLLSSSTTSVTVVVTSEKDAFDLKDIADRAQGKSLMVELVAAELDAETGEEKDSLLQHARRKTDRHGDIYYEATFPVPGDFGVLGAVKLTNQRHEEMFVKKILLNGFQSGPIQINCHSWVHTRTDNPFERVFFPNKLYLPSETPSGLKTLRMEELKDLQGDGKGERKSFDRIYDYDVYNDLGNPDKDANLARHVLGGPERPYPRRCRTGRPPTKKDPLSESKGSDHVYVPRDEAFSSNREREFDLAKTSSMLEAAIPYLMSKEIYGDTELPFPYLANIDNLFDEGVLFPDIPNAGGFLANIKRFIPRIVKSIDDWAGHKLRFETPEFIDRDRLGWLRDVEFARQTLAGTNPCCIQLVTEWPLRSKHDPEMYGQPESAITTEIVERGIGMEVAEAVQQKKLFMLDYHDLFLPFVERVRQLPRRTLYGSRTLFFLMPSGTLRPIAIELTRPKIGDKPQWKRAFEPSSDPTDLWLWRLAKAHVLAHDSGYHQLVSHWLRTHCCVEPYVIATNRQLSAMHPIYRLLHPHLRYTLEINALARGSLINAGGIIETCFFPGKYCMELSSVVYDKLWRFDLEALPADLISRGMAVEDPNAPHGLKLTIEDYPYANDGLLIWDAIKQWATDYVSHYYNEASMVQSDVELQAWWNEIRTVGHGDKRDEPWWPELNTADDLIHTLTTIIWTASGHHAAVNFGQYHYAGYVPNRPTMARSPMLVEEPSPEKWKKFMKRPEEFLLDSFPSQLQAVLVMSIIDVLSAHSEDEEYIGGQPEPQWEDNEVITAAFKIYQGKLKEIEGTIDSRNANPELKNRMGAGVVPYELLKPSSGHGVTAKGVPNSISI